MYTPNSEWDTVISRIEFTDCQPEILSSGFEAGLSEWSNVVQ
jgi:hypothetical protein